MIEIEWYDDAMWAARDAQEDYAWQNIDAREESSMFFEVTDEIQKDIRQRQIECGAYRHERHLGMQAECLLFDREDQEFGLNCAGDQRWFQEEDTNFELAYRGEHEAAETLRKYARFGYAGNNAMRIHEEAEIKEMMFEIGRATDDLFGAWVAA